MAKSVGTLIANVGANTAGFSEGIDGATEKLNKFKTDVEGIGDSTEKGLSLGRFARYVGAVYLVRDAAQMAAGEMKVLEAQGELGAAMVGQSISGIVKAQEKILDAQAEMLGHVPLIGSAIKQVVDMWGDKAGTEQFIKNLEEMEKGVVKLAEMQKKTAREVALEQARLNQEPPSEIARIKGEQKKEDIQADRDRAAKELKEAYEAENTAQERLKLAKRAQADQSTSWSTVAEKVSGLRFLEERAKINAENEVQWAQETLDRVAAAREKAERDYVALMKDQAKQIGQIESGYSEKQNEENLKQWAKWNEEETKQREELKRAPELRTDVEKYADTKAQRDSEESWRRMLRLKEITEKQDRSFDREIRPAALEAGTAEGYSASLGYGHADDAAKKTASNTERTAVAVETIARNRYGGINTVEIL